MQSTVVITATPPPTLVAPILLESGLDEVSLNPQSLPEFKQAIIQLTVAEAEAIAKAALKLDSVASVRAVVSALVTSRADDYRIKLI